MKFLKMLLKILFFLIRLQSSLQVTYSRVIEPEAKEWQLEVEVFVNLRHGRVYVRLIIAQVVVAALVEVPVHEFRSDVT